MQGDFSRVTFDPCRRYRAVHMQQGRVQLDADWNEQIDIFNSMLETQMQDLIGPAGGPRETAGFQITLQSNTAAKATSNPATQQDHMPAFDMLLSKGRYYVDGILCENERDILYTRQADYPSAPFPSMLKHHVIVYLDVWLRHINAIEDPTLREIALGGLDTTTRTKTVWQAKLLPVGDHHVLKEKSDVTYEQIVALPEWHELLNRQRQRGQLQARLVQRNANLENRLYRVEIHDVQEEGVTFKWSRENGSVVFDVQQVRQNDKEHVVCLLDREELGRDRTRLQKGDWVELVDEQRLLQGHALPLYQVQDVPDYSQGRVILKGLPSGNAGDLSLEADTHVFLRRWDHDPSNPQTPALFKIQGEGGQWIELENGLQVAFQSGARHQVGDYWLIPARAAPQSIEWPEDPAHQGHPLALPPRGTYHHYCPLALLSRPTQDSDWDLASDLRRIFAPVPIISALAERPAVSITELEEVVIAEQPGMFAVRARSLEELCRSAEDLAPGDLVSLVPGSDLEVTRATRENAQLVFGVVSAMREQGEEKRFLVTIYGRVRCNVTGSIAAGDLLSASEDAVACAATVAQTDRLFRPGAILGKALDSYHGDDTNGVGQIYVLVTLQ